MAVACYLCIGSIQYMEQNVCKIHFYTFLYFMTELIALNQFWIIKFELCSVKLNSIGIFFYAQGVGYGRFSQFLSTTIDASGPWSNFQLVTGFKKMVNFKAVRIASRHGLLDTFHCTRQSWWSGCCSIGHQYSGQVVDG